MAKVMSFQMVMKCTNRRFSSNMKRYGAAEEKTSATKNSANSWLMKELSVRLPENLVIFGDVS